MTAKNWDDIHDADKEAAMRHWSRRPQLPVTAQRESDAALSRRISANIDRLQELERLDRRVRWLGGSRWPYNGVVRTKWHGERK